MSKLKLFSGMDFSGKSTIIKIIDEEMPRVFEIHKKFLTPIDTIEKARKRERWLPAEEWKPLLQKTIKADINNYQENGLVLQDSLWIIKYLAKKKEENNPEDYEEIKSLERLLRQYPDMDSFYITASIEERIKRFNIREISGKEITGSDRLLLDIEKFENIEKCYQDIVLQRFPNTIIIDTTFKTPEEIAKEIIHNKCFKNDL